MLVRGNFVGDFWLDIGSRVNIRWCVLWLVLVFGWY